MRNRFNHWSRTLTMIVGVTGAMTLSACNSSNVAQAQAGVQTFAENAFGPNGLVDAELTPPFDVKASQATETAGADRSQSSGRHQAR